VRGWAAALFLLAGCASTVESDPRDPFEGVNRGIYRFNQALDDYVMKPVAETYQDGVPREVRDRVRNVFANLSDPMIGANNILQGKFTEGVEDWWRFVINTTVGLLGIHDPASELGLEKHNEDFGQTFGRWGMGPGPYLVLPVLGSNSLRDGAGTAVDFYTNPLTELEPNSARNSAYAVRAVQVRADLLDASRVLDEAALDKYVFQRDAYLQRRRSLVYDGRPPREKFE
jgi:phospholipid-binding lipoprotein MlaA